MWTADLVLCRLTFVKSWLCVRWLCTVWTVSLFVFLSSSLTNNRRHLSLQVIINKLLFIILNLSSLMIFFVYKSKALLISILLLWINSKNVFLVERLSPTIRNPIFDLILDCDFIWTTSQSLSQWLFMKLIKLVVKLSDHLLNTLCLFLLV